MKTVDVQIEEENGEFMISRIKNDQIVKDTKKQIKFVRAEKCDKLSDLEYFLTEGRLLFVKSGANISQGKIVEGKPMACITVEPKNNECCAVMSSSRAWSEAWVTPQGNYSFVPFEWGIKSDLKTRLKVSIKKA